VAKSPDTDRHSAPVRTKPLPPLTKAQKAAQEATNTLLQYDRTLQLIEEAKTECDRFRLRPHVILELNRLSIQRIESEAGRWRDVPMRIGKSKHKPPLWQDVPRYIDEMCEYINDNWRTKSALHLAAHVMWRLNWIHPFIDGNGRTTRAVSYYVLCVKLGFQIPDVTTIPELISSNKTPYYAALEAADQAWSDGKIDLSRMENLLRNLLARQMMLAIGRAGTERQDPISRVPTREHGTVEAVADRVSEERPDLASVAAPDGTVTILFSDIEGSTALNASMGDARWMELLREHNRIVRREVRSNHGFEVKTIGDAFMVAFQSAKEAAQCGIGIQAAFSKRNQTADYPIKVRVGLHTGELVREEDDFYGWHVNFAARVASQAAAGEVLVSSLFRDVVEPSGELKFQTRGKRALKGFKGKHEVFAVTKADEEHRRRKPARQVRQRIEPGGKGRNGLR
jgi:class 3 adenylate cyclase